MKKGEDKDAQPIAAVKSADRVLDLFELLGRWEREMSHTEIASALTIPKSSLSLLLRNLVGRGYLEFSPSTKGYRLGRAFSVLARQSGREFDLIACAEPILKSITATLGESSALNRLKGQKVEIIATVVSPQRLVTHMHVGDLAPLYATSSGKVILAHLPDELQKEYLAKMKLKRVTHNTIRSIDTLKKQLEAARRTGLAYSQEEFTPGIVGVAAVVPGALGHPLGALHIAMPAVRSNPEVIERAAQVLQRASKAMLKQIAQVRDAKSLQR